MKKIKKYNKRKFLKFKKNKNHHQDPIPAPPEPILTDDRIVTRYLPWTVRTAPLFVSLLQFSQYQNQKKEETRDWEIGESRKERHFWGSERKGLITSTIICTDINVYYRV